MKTSHTCLETQNDAMIMQISCKDKSKVAGTLSYTVTPKGEAVIRNIHYANGFDDKVAHALMQTLAKEHDSLYSFNAPTALTADELRTQDTYSIPQPSSTFLATIKEGVNIRDVLKHASHLFKSGETSQSAYWAKVDSCIMQLDRLEGNLCLSKPIYQHILSDNRDVALKEIRQSEKSFEKLAGLEALPTVEAIDCSDAEPRSFFTKDNLLGLSTQAKQYLGKLKTIKAEKSKQMSK